MLKLISERLVFKDFGEVQLRNSQEIKKKSDPKSFSGEM